MFSAQTYVAVDVARWLFAGLVAYWLAGQVRLQPSAIVRDWDERAAIAARVLLWVVSTGLISTALARLTGLGLTLPGLVSYALRSDAADLTMAELLGDLQFLIAYSLYFLDIALWVALLLVTLRLVNRPSWERAPEATKWLQGSWQRLVFATVLAGLAAWPFHALLSLWSEVWALRMAHFAEYIDTPPAWTSAARLVGIVAAYSLGALVARSIIGELQEWWPDYPDWAKQGSPGAAIWLALTGALASGIVTAVTVATDIGWDAQQLASSIRAAAPGQGQYSGGESRWFLLALHVLPLGAYWVSDRVFSRFDHLELDKLIDWYPSPRQERLLLLAVAWWLMWPLEIPLRFYVTMPRIGLNQSDAPRYALGLLVAAALIWVFAFYRPAASDDSTG